MLQALQLAVGQAAVRAQAHPHPPQLRQQDLVRNSWGESWGEKGFVYVQYGKNVCGITTQAAITTPATVSALHDEA